MERYSKIFPITCSGEKKSHVKFSMVTNNSSKGSQGKEIVIQLTKDENPLFFYSCRMSDDEFRQFKIQQDLKVDFSNFPSMVVNLLECVLAEDSKYFIIFDDSGVSSTDGIGSSRRVSALLKIVQSAGHKDLTHLALKFYPADPKQIQTFLADTILHLKKRLAIMERQNRQLEGDNRRHCENADEVLSKTSEEKESLKREFDANVAKMTKEFEEEKLGIRTTFEHERMELELKCAGLEEQNQHLQEQLRGSNTDVESVREEFQHLNEEVIQMRERLEDYRREVIEMEKMRNDLLSRLESAEDDAESKDVELGEMRDRFQNLLDENRQLEHALSEWTGRAKHFEDLYNVQRNETEKAVEIMQKCVNYSKIYKDKGAKVELIARKQQEMLKSRESEFTKLRSDNERLAKEVNELREEKMSLASGIDDMKRQAQEQATLLADKETIMAGMSKQLSELRLIVNPGQTSTRPMDYGALFSAQPAIQECNGDRRATTSFKTPPAVSGNTGKENRTPFLHPKYSART